VIYQIRYFGDPVLRRRAAQVNAFRPDLERLAADMIATMYDANGVGLAAPQIGLAKRIFVAVETGPTEEDAGGDDDEFETEQDMAGKRQSWGVVAEHVMVNPEIVERSGRQLGQDGCLSLPGLFVDEVERDLRIRVRYQDTSGNPHEIEAEGRFAHIIQHELDHLDGVLFFDRLPPDQREMFLNEHRSELAEFQREAKRLLKSVRREPPQLPSL
jgi:peptide deformylase